jgi:hypothetical protein
MQAQYRGTDTIPSVAPRPYFPLFSPPSGTSIRGVRVAPALFLAFIVASACQAVAVAQQPGSVTEEEKRRQFLKAREEMHTIPPAPRPETTPKPKPKPARVTPQPEPVPATPAPTTPRPPPETTPRPRPKPEPEPTPRARATPPPIPPQRVTPAPLTPPPLPPAPVLVEKSGIEEERGNQPAPPAGWWTRWKYLSKSVREEIDRAPVKKRRWRYIVVHNSGTRQGSAKAFEYYHLHVRKMPNGLAYHFVIGNGSSTGDGEIEIGNRWRRQINGGHVHSDYLNNIALGICLVGDFNRDQPTSRQLEALEELTRYLRQRVGKIDRKWAIVKAHREINPPRWPTDCPGDHFPYRWMHGKFD